METCLNCFKEAMKLKEVEAREYSPLALAYLGDAVYELAIRTFVMNHGNTQVNKMHKKTAGLVKAEAQANFYKVLEEELTEEEKAAAAGFGAGIAQSAPPAQSAASAGADTQQPASQVNTQPAASEVAAGQAEDVLAQDAGAWPTE